MPATFATGKNWTKLFADAIGLDGRSVKSLTIHSSVDSVLSADLTMYVTKEGSEKLEEVMKTYFLAVRKAD